VPARPQLTLAGPAHLTRHRLTLRDGARTTLHVAEHDVARTEVRVVRLRRTEPLEAWCAREGIDEALVGGFYLRGARGGLTPLGELRTRGIRRRSVPFTAPWDATRACLHAVRGVVRLLPRDELPAAPPGDLLQAGPLLVSEGRATYVDGEDAEGFGAAAEQFDSDITAERHPRAAVALVGGPPARVLAVACDGRDGDEAGLTLGELAQALAGLGATAALNLDGGGSTSLVCAGRLRNTPRAEPGVVLPQGRAVATALAFLPR